MPQRKTPFPAWPLYSAVALLVGTAFIAVALPPILEGLRAGREQVAINQLRNFHIVEMQFKSTHGRFASLKELTDKGLIAKGVVYASSYYLFSSSEVTTNTYCIHATRENSGTAFRDFNISETGKVQAVLMKTPTVVKRNEGLPIE